MKNEYIIWGVPPDRNHEDLLMNKIYTFADAKKYKKICEDKHKCKEVRISYVDFSKKDVDEMFLKAVNKI